MDMQFRNHADLPHFSRRPRPRGLSNQVWNRRRKVRSHSPQFRGSGQTGTKFGIGVGCCARAAWVKKKKA